LSFNRKGELERDRVTFKLTVEPHGRWKLCVDLTPIEGAKPRAPLLRCDSFGAPEPAMPLALQEWLERAPELEAGDDLQHVYQSSLVGPYYGTHDATQLFLILLDEYERWSGDAAFVRKLEPNARAALTWIDEQGDLDGDGYLEYESRSAKGLTNHCWKDSDDSIQFADGRPAEGPIATCEIQGYAYDARLRAARLARELWGDDELAADQERKAKKLRDRFNRDFWDDELGYYVLALDGRKHRVDAIASNAGHLLWSGIVPKNRARLVADRLLRDDLFSGWGIRCLSSEIARLQPARVSRRHRVAARLGDLRRGHAALRPSRARRTGLRGGERGGGRLRAPLAGGLRRLRPRRDRYPGPLPGRAGTAGLVSWGAAARFADAARSRRRRREAPLASARAEAARADRPQAHSGPGPAPQFPLNRRSMRFSLPLLG